MNPTHRIHHELHGLNPKKYNRAWLHKRSVENIAAGKLWNGKPRTRAIRFDLIGLSRTERHVITNRERRQRLKQTA